MASVSHGVLLHDVFYPLFHEMVPSHENSLLSSDWLIYRLYSAIALHIAQFDKKIIYSRMSLVTAPGETSVNTKHLRSAAAYQLSRNNI